MGPKSSDRCPHEKRRRHRLWGDGQVGAEADMGDMRLHRNECPGLLEATGSWGRGMEQTPPQSRRTDPADTLVWDFRPPEPWENTLLVF